MRTQRWDGLLVNEHEMIERVRDNRGRYTGVLGVTRKIGARPEITGEKQLRV